MDVESHNLILSWLVALGPYVLAGVFALLGFLGKRVLDNQDELVKTTNQLDKGLAVSKKDVEKNAGDIARHQKWLEEHQNEIQVLKSGQ